MVIGPGCEIRLYRFLIIAFLSTLPGCSGLAVISSAGVPTGTGFCLVTIPDLHLVLLMAELGFIASQTNVMRERDRSGGGGGGGAVWWFGWDNGWPEAGLIVMQGNLNARVYIEDVLRPHVIPLSRYYFQT